MFELKIGVFPAQIEGITGLVRFLRAGRRPQPTEQPVRASLRGALVFALFTVEMSVFEFQEQL